MSIDTILSQIIATHHLIRGFIAFTFSFRITQMRVVHWASLTSLFILFLDSLAIGKHILDSSIQHVMNFLRFLKIYLFVTIFLSLAELETSEKHQNQRSANEDIAKERAYKHVENSFSQSTLESIIQVAANSSCSSQNNEKSDKGANVWLVF